MRRWLAALACTSLLACAKTSDTGAVQQMGSTNDPVTVQAAIDAQLARFVNAMVKSDTLTMHSVYTDDAKILPANHKIITNRAEHAEYDRGMLSAVTFQAAGMKTSDLIVTGDYAIETGAYTMTIKPKTGRAFADTGKYVAVWQKQPDGSWKMIRDVFNSDKPAGP